MVTTELVVLDMAGTTVADDGLVIRAFTEAIAAAGVSEEDTRYPGMLDYVVETMGQSKIVVFRTLLDGNEDLAQRANTEFQAAYGKLVADGHCEPIPGAEETIQELQARGVKVALTTGFAPATQNAILDALGWQGLADAVLAPGDGVRGRPFPDLVLTAALGLEIGDVRRIAVAGDTPSDIQTGLSSGASLVAGVLTGSATKPELEAAGATHVLESVRDLTALLS
ncbi:phosphonatase-like hydrolase [Amycolatopsis regifaucium]|uniref:Haloacid dehalogenase n=1 Tax=Amycolatopsis regifaucium TaxID=546365 RepID=A0A154MK41_9PSEU|nr:phosphonatase-like hydrolase [Amycolatopsis regifaucium]KZB84403.1 haloacid dehalogenase [Amycolatopsis regifaucium]OKA10866.1 haloacid dehalogenase [Amycolatopsis regifaucium]SFI20340.1 phosphonatase-like hydrolase [Amycolatopsis regifaucium]